MKGITTEQKQFSALCEFIQPPPTKEEVKKGQPEVKLDSQESPIKRGSQKQ